MDLIKDCHTPEAVVTVATQEAHQRMEILDRIKHPQNYPEALVESAINKRYVFIKDGKKIFVDISGKVYGSAEPDAPVIDHYKRDNFSMMAYLHEPLEGSETAQTVDSRDPVLAGPQVLADVQQKEGAVAQPAEESSDPIKVEVDDPAPASVRDTDPNIQLPAPRNLTPPAPRPAATVPEVKLGDNGLPLPNPPPQRRATPLPPPPPSAPVQDFHGTRHSEMVDPNTLDLQLPPGAIGFARHRSSPPLPPAPQRRATPLPPPPPPPRPAATVPEVRFGTSRLPIPTPPPVRITPPPPSSPRTRATPLPPPSQPPVLTPPPRRSSSSQPPTSPAGTLPPLNPPARRAEGEKKPADVDADDATDVVFPLLTDAAKKAFQPQVPLPSEVKRARFAARVEERFRLIEALDEKRPDRVAAPLPPPRSKWSTRPYPIRVAGATAAPKKGPIPSIRKVTDQDSGNNGSPRLIKMREDLRAREVSSATALPVFLRPDKVLDTSGLPPESQAPAPGSGSAVTVVANPFDATTVVVPQMAALAPRKGPPPLPAAAKEGAVIEVDLNDPDIEVVKEKHQAPRKRPPPLPAEAQRSRPASDLRATQIGDSRALATTVIDEGASLPNPEADNPYVDVFDGLTLDLNPNK